MRFGCGTASVLLSVVLLSLSTLPVGAQEVEWDAEAELGGSLFFGNQSQTVFTSRGFVEREHPNVESSLEGRFNFGRATDDDGEAFVSRRSWKGEGEVDLLPDGRLNPTFSGSVEKSLERRIALRYDVGGGMRATFVRTDRSRAEATVQFMAEQTRAREDDHEGDGITARWSSRVRLSRELADGRMELRNDTRFRPAWDDLRDFTLTARNVLSLELTDQVLLRFTLLNEYDSGAVARGARTNNDGQLQITLVAEF